MGAVCAPPGTRAPNPLIPALAFPLLLVVPQNAVFDFTEQVKP